MNFRTLAVFLAFFLIAAGARSFQFSAGHENRTDRTRSLDLSDGFESSAAATFPGLTSPEREIIAEIFGNPDRFGINLSDPEIRKLIADLYKKDPGVVGKHIAALHTGDFFSMTGALQGEEYNVSIFTSPDICNRILSSDDMHVSLPLELHREDPEKFTDLIEAKSREDPDGILSRMPPFGLPSEEPSPRLVKAYADSFLRASPEIPFPDELRKIVRYLSAAECQKEMQSLASAADQNPSCARLVKEWLPALAGKNPSAAWDLLLEHPEYQTQTSVIEKIFSDVRFSENANDGVLPANLPAPVQEAMQRGLLLSALARAQQDLADPSAVSGLTDEFTKRYPSASLAFLLRDDRVPFDLLRSICETNPGAAASLAAPLVETWAKSDAVAASEMLDSMAEPPDSAISALVRNIGSDPEAQFRWASRIREPELRRSLMADALAVLTGRDPARAAILAEEIK